MNMESLFANLSNPDETERIYAAEDIGFEDNPAAIGPLLQRLEVESSRAVKLAVFQALGRMTDPGVITAAVGLLRSEDSLVRNEAVELLKHRGEAALPALAAAAGDSNKDVRKFSLDALSGLTTVKSDGIYADALKDSDINVVITAVEHIGKQRRLALRGDVERIFLQTGDSMLTTACLEAFGQLGDSACLSAVRAKFSDWIKLSAFHRMTLIRMLGAVGGPGDYGALVARLRTSGTRAVEPVLEALAAIRSRHPKTYIPAEALPLLCSLIEECDSTMIKYRALALAGCLPPSQETYDILSRNLNSLDRLGRLGAIEGLSHLRHPEVKSSLEGRLQTEDDTEVQSAIKYVLERMEA